MHGSGFRPHLLSLDERINGFSRLSHKLKARTYDRILSHRWLPEDGVLDVVRDRYSNWTWLRDVWYYRKQHLIASDSLFVSLFWCMWHWLDPPGGTGLGHLANYVEIHTDSEFSERAILQICHPYLLDRPVLPQHFLNWQFPLFAFDAISKGNFVLHVGKSSTHTRAWWLVRTLI